MNESTRVVSTVVAALVCALGLAAGQLHAAGNYETTVLADNPHWYLRLDEPNGSSVAADTSPNAINGVYNQFAPPDGVPTSGVAGIPGGGPGNTAAEFHGTSPVSQIYVADAAHPVDYTIEAWFKADAGATTGRNILVRTAGNPTTTFAYQLRVEPNGLPRHYSYSATGAKYLDGNAPIVADQWYHVVGTATSGNPGHFTTYVNGELQKEWNGNAGLYWNGGNQWRIGSIAGGGTWFDGVIDEVAVYHSELSAERIWQHYRQGAIVAPRDATPLSGPAPKMLDLADMVGHGNGTGTGTFLNGINPGTGALVDAATANPGQINGPGFHPVDLPFVDGVFIPGAAGYMQIASTGLTMQHNYPARDGNSWDHFRNGPTGGVSPVLGGVDYTSPGHSLIGMHANKGITFDLDAIRAANGGMDVNQFTTTFGDVSASGGNIDVNVYLDGVLTYGVGGVLTSPIPIQVAVGASNRFLTILATDGGDTFSYDQVMFGDPKIELANNIAYGKPAFATSTYSAAFGVANVTDGDVNEAWTHQADNSFWIAPNGTLADVIVDLEGEFLIDRVDLQNTHNAQYRDRGTEDFAILVSLDGATWTEVLDDTLGLFTPANAALRNTPLETFEFDPTWARYVKLRVDSYYGTGAGLNEIRVFEAVPEPATMALLGLAACGLGGYVRRRRKA